MDHLSFLSPLTCPALGKCFILYGKKRETKNKKHLTKDCYLKYMGEKILKKWTKNLNRQLTKEDIEDTGIPHFIELCFISLCFLQIEALQQLCIVR